MYLYTPLNQTVLERMKLETSLNPLPIKEYYKALISVESVIHILRYLSKVLIKRLGILIDVWSHHLP